MRAVPAKPSAKNLEWGCDTLATLKAPDFDKLAARSIVWRAGYIEKITAEELNAQLTAGIAYLPVTLALDFNAVAQIAKLKALGIPEGVTVFLDVEGHGLDPFALIGHINSWAAMLQATGYEAGLYIGAGCDVLSDVQLYALKVTRYWHSVSRVPDPKTRGCCIRQLRPNDVEPTGVDIDVDVVEPDYEGGLPTFCAA